uniref:Uncharacterized protein n=1 Tax=Ditylenchus dipsaci TaxID=166011 RepID=A0A915DUT2_9BILA
MAPPLVSGGGSLTYSPTLALAKVFCQHPATIKPAVFKFKYPPSKRQLSSSIRMLVASVCIMAMFASTTLAAPAPTKTNNQEMQPDKRSFDSFNSRGFTGFDKRAFDSLASRGFLGFDKRAFDSFAGTFSGLDKRSFDSFNSRGFTGFDKRSPFDSFVGSGFTGMDKRNAFDSFNSRGFTGFDKRAFDSFNSRGFTGLTS